MGLNGSPQLKNLHKNNPMKQFILWLGRVPGSIKKIIDKVLRITTVIIAFLKSDTALLVTNIIPGEQDEAIRQALILALEAFKDAIDNVRKTKDVKAYKKLAGAIGAHMTATLDKNDADQATYVQCFERVYQQSKIV